ncbi:MAG TPA: RHS repeat domain-containing protein [Allosphingosinicella sp.]|nr:RHS repeat domain-containing protein [Allosphingosinicella sp.]
MVKGGARLFLATSLCALTQAAQSAETISYGYDSLGRLVRVERSGSVNDGVSAQYSYDSADNRTNVTVAGVPMVLGGGFERPEVHSGYDYRAASDPSNFSGNSGVAGNGSAWGFALAPEGDQVAFLQAYSGTGASLRLAVTGLTPGISYTLRFHIAARPGYGANPVAVAFSDVALGTFVPASSAFAPVASAAFTASGPTGAVTFTGSASGDLATGLDRVTIAVTGSQ